MTVLSRWRIDRMPDYTNDCPDMIEPAHILIEDHRSGEVARSRSRTWRRR